MGLRGQRCVPRSSGHTDQAVRRSATNKGADCPSSALLYLITSAASSNGPFGPEIPTFLPAQPGVI